MGTSVEELCQKGILLALIPASHLPRRNSIKVLHNAHTSDSQVLCLRSHCTLREHLELCSHIHPPPYLLRQSAWFLLHHSLGMVLGCAGSPSADSALLLLL